MGEKKTGQGNLAEVKSLKETTS